MLNFVVISVDIIYAKSFDLQFWTPPQMIYVVVKEFLFKI